MRNGIAGLLRLDGRATDPGDTAQVDAMAKVISHRGLVRRRVERRGPLAIAASEPDGLIGGDGSSDVVAVVDGFISNAGELRRDLTSRGARVGSHAHAVVVSAYETYGDKFVDHLCGSFAIALWDPRRRALVLARDRAGVRPLYVARPRADLFLFGSEQKTLLAHPDCPRQVDWLGTLARFALPLKSFAPHAYFLGIDPVAPGTMQVADTHRGAVETRTYWSLQFVSDDDAASDRRSDADIIAGYGEVLRTAVEDAFGDQSPAALFLSGGIDSIAVAALGRAHRPETFTALNVSTWTNGDAGVAHAAAQHLGLVNHQVLLRRGTLTPEHWQKFVWTTESARCRGQDYLKGQLAHHVHRVAPDLRVLLHGEGSDELIGADTRNYSDHEGEESYDIYIRRLRGMQREQLQTFETLAVESWFGDQTVFADTFLAAASGRPVPTQPMQRRAVYCLEGLAELVLAREDRFAAVNGMEARAPFVDHRLLQFVASIPPRAYSTLYWRKHVLRHSLRRELPDELRLQRKVGFFAGNDARFTCRMLVDLVTADGGALLRAAFGDPNQHAVLAPGFIDQLVAQTVQDPDAAAIDGLLTLVNLGLLEGMARDVAGQARLNELATPMLTELESWNEAALPGLFADSRRAIDVDKPLVLAPSVELAAPVQGDGDVLWICFDSSVRYVVDEPETKPWRAVLRRLEPGRPLREILASLDLSLDAIRKYLEEAIEFEVVVFED